MARGMEGASNQLKEEEEEEDEGIEEEGYTASVPMPLNIYKTHSKHPKGLALFFVLEEREREMGLKMWMTWRMMSSIDGGG